MIPRAYPQVPVRAKVAVAPYVVLLVVVLGVLDDRGVIDLGGGAAAATPHHRPRHRPPAAARPDPGPAGGAEVPPAYLAAYRRCRLCRGTGGPLDPAAVATAVAAAQPGGRP